MRKIGVLTSGGDAPGMNAAIRAIVRAATGQNIEVLGFKRGYNGLISGDFEVLKSLSVTGILGRGGTILKTDRCKEFMMAEVRQKAMEICEKLQVEALIGIGGNGTFCGLQKISELGIACIGIPGTIDNDIPSTEHTIGFDTATNTALWMLDSLRDTVKSHNRCMIVEVMGRESGAIAITTAIACGATFVLLPEDDPEESSMRLISKLKKSITMGADHFLVVMAEGYKGKNGLIAIIEKETGCEAKVDNLGYVQRGGVPTARDRLIASQMGAKGVELLQKGHVNRVVVMKEGEISDVCLHKALDEKIENKKHAKLSKLVSELSDLTLD